MRKLPDSARSFKAAMANTRRLSDGLLQGALSKHCRTWLTDDDGTRGGGRLVARVTGASHLLFYFRYCVDGKMTFIPIGPYSPRTCEGRFTLTQARAKASEYSAAHRAPETRNVVGALHRCSDALVVQATVSAPLANDPARSLAALCTFYAEELKRLGKKSAASTAYDVKKHIASNPACEVNAAEVSPTMIAGILRPIYAHSKRNAGKLRAYMSAAYEKARLAPTSMEAVPGWLPFGIQTNPVSGTAALGKSGTRDRTLARHELGWLLLYLELSSLTEQTTYRALRLNLLLGCQRARQLLRCRLEDYDVRERTLKLLDGKGRRDEPRVHELPLIDRALDEVTALLLIAKATDTPFVFPGRRPDAPLNHHTLSKLVTFISSELIGAGLVPEHKPFTYLDLRRTAESRMIEIKIPSDVLAVLLSHGLSGVQKKNYDRANYMNLLRETLTTWDSFLRRCADEQRDTFLSAFEQRFKSGEWSLPASTTTD
jgi:hypothetical protein